MKTGWQKINDYWYYFNSSADDGTTGNMKKGWYKIRGTWYYLSVSDGIMAANTWVNGYYLDSNGAWIPGSSNSQILTFADENLEQVIRNNIDKPTGTLYKNDVENITQLIIPHSISNISNLSGIENLVNLEYFQAAYSNISDISPLKGLPNLKHLALAHSQIIDINPLKELTNLESLSLLFNGKIKDVSPLSGLTNLKSLELSYNQINDISPLKELTNLTMLELRSNPISDADKQSLRDALPQCNISY